MAERTKSASGTTSKNKMTAKELQEWYDKNAKNIENYAKAQETLHTLRDVTSSSTRSIPTINKTALKGYISNVGSNERNLRNTARYLYYRSNIFFRLVNWYADMWDLNCREVVPKYSLIKDNDQKKFLKSYNDTLDMLELFNLQENMTEVFINVYIQDVYYGLRFTDETGTFFYPLEPDECVIDGRYCTGDFSFAMDMSRWKSNARQKIIEYIGSPLKEMWEEYNRTNIKYIHCPDEYAVCFKFRTDTWDMAVPPMLPLYLSLAGLEDKVDLEAEADALSIYKMIYLPMKVHTNTNDVDDYLISPDIMHKYFKKMLDNEAIPANVSAAMIPGDELKVIDFSKSVEGDITNVEKTQNQILGTSGGGAVINANGITSTAAFNAWLEAESQFAMSTLIGQVNGACNRWLSYEISNPAKVKHFEVSVYTKQKLADQLLESCKYSFSNRLAYNTCLGISEKQTLALEFLENTVLGLPAMMNHPLTSSFTQSGTSGEVGQGAPTKPDDELSGSGERSRNR